MNERALRGLDLALMLPQPQERLELSLGDGARMRCFIERREVARDRMHDRGQDRERTRGQARHSGRIGERESLRRDVAEDQHQDQHHRRGDVRPDIGAEPEQKKCGRKALGKDV